MNFFVRFIVYIFTHVPMRFRFMRNRFLLLKSRRISWRRLHIMGVRLRSSMPKYPTGFSP